MSSSSAFQSSGSSLPEYDSRVSELLVGNEPCSYLAVCDVLEAANSSGSLWIKLVDLSRGLGTPEEFSRSIRQWLLLETKTHHSVLYEILETWRGKESSGAKLISLIHVLELRGLQEGADALKSHFKIASTDKTSWNDISDNLKLEISKKLVIFQGNKIKLTDCIGDYVPINMDKKFLAKLTEDKIPTLVNNPIQANLQYYIQRSIQSRTKLKKEVFQTSSSDIIMVEGIGRIELTRLAEGKETDLSGNQIKKRIITVKLLLLECDGDFERICKLATQPVHWIKIEKDSYLWFKSSGTVENLQKYVHELQETFIESNLLSVKDRVVIVSDSPGMGKTLLLANIGKFFFKRSPTTLVGFIVLKELVQELSNQPISIEFIVSRIAEQSSDYHFGREFTEHIFKTSECILMFDGFDEVLSNQIDTAKQILKEVVGKLASARIFITTRPHMRGELENALHVFSYTIQPFEGEDAVNFLQAFWKSNGVTTCISTYEFAKSILSSLTSNMTDFERSIAGIPLQCRLLAEAYMDEARRCTEMGYRAETNDSKSSGLVATLFEMYERHMNIRFQKFCSEHSGVQIDSIKQEHMHLALHTVFPEIKDDVLSHREPCTLISTDNMCRLGILEATQLNGIRFVHRTFAEYFIAWYAIEQEQDEEVRKFLLSKVFTTLPVNCTIPCRNSLYYVDLMSSEFNFPVICYFINEFVKRKKGKVYGQDSLSTMPLLGLFCNNKDPFFASVSHNFIYMLEFVSNLLGSDSKIENWTEDVHIDKIGDLMLVTAKYGDVEMMKIFATQINITEVTFRSSSKIKKELCVITPLHVAIKRGHYNLVEYLINQYKSELLSLCHLLNICVYNSLENSTEVIDNKKLIIKLLLTHSKQWLEERFLNSSTPLLQYETNPELIECLIQEGADVNALGLENTVLHRIAKNPVLPEMLHRIVKSVCDHGFKHFNKKNHKELSPLSSAVKSVELLDETLEIFFSSGTDFNAVDEDGNSVVFNAIAGGRSVHLIQRLIHFGANWKHINQRNESVLHQFAFHGHYNAMKYFLENNELDINALNSWLKTPLHTATSRTSPNHELLQRLLMESGANVNAAGGELQFTPFQEAFERHKGISLNIIKLMEQNGLLITNTSASEVLQGILHNKRILPDGELSNIFEYLIQKLGPHHQSQTVWNPWKFEKLRQKTNEMIQLITVTPEFMSKLKDFSLLTANDVMQLEQTRTILKTERLYEIVQGNEASFERFCLSLLSTNQFRPFELLRDTLETVEDFTTVPPGVTQLLNSNDMRIIVLLTNNVDMTTKRINDTIGANVNFLDERDVATFIAGRKKLDLTVVKCRDITMDLITELQRAATFVKIIILCQNHHLELNGQIQTFKDEFTWEDISARSLRRCQCTVDQIDVDLREVFATADVLEHFLIENKIAISCRNLGYKVGHRIGNNGIPLSKTIFHHFLCDKLVFVGITQAELQQYTNLEHQIGSLGKNIESLDYIVCDYTHEFEEICRQTSCNVHLIEHHEGSFMLVRSFGFDNEIKQFYIDPVLCDNFPECNCETGLDDLMISFTFQLTGHSGVTKTGPFPCKVYDLRPKMQRMLKLQYFMDLFQLTRINGSLLPQDKVEYPSLVTDKIVEQLCLRIFNKIRYLLNCLQTTKEEYHKLEQIAVNTLFPKLQNSTDISDLKKFAGVGMLLYKNDSLVFLNEPMAWFFVAKMVLKGETEEVLKDEIFLNCFESRNIYDSISLFLFRHGIRVISCPTESVESFTYSNSLFFTFLDHLLTQESRLTLINNLKIILSKEIKKWVHSCVCANHYNLLKFIVNSGNGPSVFASEKLVLLAVKYACVPLISLVVEQYISRTKQNIKHIKSQCYQRDDKVTVLHIAALRGDLSVVSYLLNKLGFEDTLNQPDMINILHYCVVDTLANCNKEIEERKFIIELLLQHSPNLIQEKDNNYSTPGLVPNIHVDLLIYLIELGLDVDATEEEGSNNLMHVCPLYMTPQDYHKLVEYLHKCGKSEIFHSKKQYDERVLHCAIKYLEVFQSTFDLFIAANVDFNAINYRGRSVLFEAIRHGRSACLLKRLILSGADVLIRDWYGSTVLHEAGRSGNFSSLKYLVSQKCDVRAIDKENNTPLHLVLKWPENHTYEIVKILLQHGASAHDVNRKGKTPLSIALANKDGKIGSATVKLLKNASEYASEYDNDSSNYSSSSETDEWSS